jgi:hypothetical protein
MGIVSNIIGDIRHACFYNSKYPPLNPKVAFKTRERNFTKKEEKKQRKNKEKKRKKTSTVFLFQLKIIFAAINQKISLSFFHRVLNQLFSPQYMDLFNATLP